MEGKRNVAWILKSVVILLYLYCIILLPTVWLVIFINLVHLDLLKKKEKKIGQNSDSESGDNPSFEVSDIDDDWPSDGGAVAIVGEGDGDNIESWEVLCCCRWRLY